MCGWWAVAPPTEVIQLTGVNLMFIPIGRVGLKKNEKSFGRVAEI